MTSVRIQVRYLPLLCTALLTLCAAAQAQLPAGTLDASSSRTATQDPLRTQAADAIERNDMPAALKYLSELNEREPENPQILFNLGSAQEALDQISNAEATYRHAIKLNPAYLEPHLALGLLLARTNHPAEARTELQAATTATMGTPTLQARAFRALAELDRTTNPEEAREALLSALKLTPESPDDALLSASLAEQAGDLPAAEKAYRRTLARTPNDAAATVALARLLIRQDKLEEAGTLLAAAHQTSPDDPALSAQLATLYARQGDLEKARALVEPLHAAHPAEPSITRLYARILSQTGDFAAAEPLFATLRKSSPNDADLADDHADALIHLKRFAEAEAILKPALKSPAAFSSKEDFAGAASHLAFAASQNNDPETVLQAVALRATVMPQSPATVFLEAISRDKLHQAKQAQVLYRQFLSVANGKFPDEEWEARHRLIALEHSR